MGTFDGARTHDFPIRSQALYLLRHWAPQLDLTCRGNFKLNVNQTKINKLQQRGMYMY